MLGLVFPARCVFCGVFLERNAPVRVCSACSVAHVLPAGGETQLPDGTACYYPVYYSGRVRAALLRYKFKGRSQAAATFAALMADALCLAQDVDVATWVPVSFRRGFVRGYDQSHLLCRHMARRVGIKAKRLLVKRRHTPAQSGLSARDARRENVRGAYRTVGGADIRGRSVLLVDDVLTTGATLSECVHTLYEDGASRVVCAVFAYAKSGRGACIL